MTDPTDAITPPPGATPHQIRSRGLNRWLGRPSPPQRQLLDLFVAAMVEDFESGGPAAIAAVRLYDPVNYLRLVAVLVPRQLEELNARNPEYDDEVADALDRVRDLVAAYESGVGKMEPGWRPSPETPAL